MNRNAGAVEGLFEVDAILFRRTQKDGHAVEPNPLASQRQCTPGDFDAFPALARGGKDLDTGGRIACCKKGTFFEKVALEPAQSAAAPDFWTAG